MAGVNVTEGPLSKWTNVVKGWQYRWFVLDENRGILSYYTSKEKMQRGSMRGCVRLKGAMIGIDDEDDSTFTITVDDKTFHFQARDGDERESWINALENVILMHSTTSRRAVPKPPCGAATFEAQLTETDVYLQILIDQVQNLERRMEICDNSDELRRFDALKNTAKEMIEAVKHCIVALQISKESLKGSALNGVQVPEPYFDVTDGQGVHEETSPRLTEEQEYQKKSSQSDLPIAADDNECNHASELRLDDDIITEDSLQEQNKTQSCGISATSSTSLADGALTHIPETSYSSSEDEPYFDAHEYKISTDEFSSYAFESAAEFLAPEVISGEDNYYDELYDTKDAAQLDSLQQHGSLISHLISQVRIGMDLTKVVLPTFILETRSLLEMYADFLAHPDIFCSIADKATAEERMVEVVRWYVSAFHAGRQGDVAKKPYNPIIGETFSCCWKIPNAKSSSELVSDGPVPWATKEHLAFISEQVSHHPPISAFYAENYNKRISIDGYIWTKSKFLGLSIGVHLIGQSVISVLDHDEEYIFSFPNGYGRSILTVPWFELGGKVSLSCAKSGYSAQVTFHTKPFYGGKRHRVTAEIFSPNEKKPFCNIEGAWNGSFTAKYPNMETVFIDTTRVPVVKKIVKPREQQGEFESRRLWQGVTKALKEKNVVEATERKLELETRQRNEAKERKDRNVEWETKNFHEIGGHWLYDRPLLKRVQTTPR